MSNTYSVSNVNVGTYPNDGQGDPLRTAFITINQNFTNVYAYANLAYYNGLGGGGGGNVSNAPFYNPDFEGWPNITTTNLAILANKLANITPTNLGRLANALANVAPINLGALNNALANVNYTSLSNFTNAFNTLTSNATASNVAVGLVSNLTANGTANGQAVYNVTDGGLYIWGGNSWISPGAAFTPTANSISGVEIFQTFSLATGPGDGRDFEGRQGFYNNKLYIFVSGGWNLYDTYIAGTGNVVLSANIITSSMIVAGAITAGKIGAAAISAAEIQANAITSSLIAANAIIAGKIGVGVITAVEIAANAITATELAANSVYADALQANVITANKIAANSITAVQLAANAVYANAIQTNSITAAQIAANAITAVELAANSVYADAIQANCITANQIAANAVTAVEIAANSVFTYHLVANAITANQIAANAITSVSVAANAITADKIDSRGLTIRDLNGNILFAAGTGVLSANLRVSLPGGGTQLLTELASNATPKWLELKNDAPGFGVANGTWTNQSNILLTANLSGMVGTATFSIVNGTGTLTNTADPNAKRLLFEDMITDSLSVKAVFVDGPDNYDDIVNLYKVYNGNTTPLMYLTDENRTIPASAAGVVTSFAGVATQAVVYEGLNDTSSTWSFTTAAVGCTITGTNTRNITVTAMSADTATVTFTASKAGASNLTKVYNLSKAKAGVQGTAGAAGTNGTNGIRGSTQTAKGYAGQASWDDAKATSAIADLGFTNVIRDQVTLFNSSNPASFSETRFWTGTAWSPIAAYINGGLVVNGTISANQLAADSVDASKIQAGAVTASEIAAGAITAGKIAAGAVTATTIAAGAITADKIGPGTTAMAAGYRFSLGQGGSIPVNSTQANAVILAVSTTFPVFAGLFESKNGSPAIVCATPVISAAYGRDVSYATSGWECEPLIAIRGRDSNYTQQWHKSAILAHGRLGMISTSYVRSNSLTSATFGAFAGKHPPDQNMNLTVDLEYGSTPTGEKSAGGIWLAYSRNSARWARSSSLGGDFPVTLVSYINHSDGTGAAGTFTSGGTGGSPDNFGAQFSAYACENSVIPGGINNHVTASLRLAQDLSYTGVDRGRALWVFKGESQWEPGCRIIANGIVLAFTGGHSGLYDKNEIIEPGDIVIDTPTVIHGNMDNNLTVITKSTAPMQKAVIGVFGKDTTGATIPFPIKSPTTTTLSNVTTSTGTTLVEKYSSEDTVKEEYAELYANSKVCDFNALGEGLISVCGENGNLEIGDNITTSSIPGKGMKQSDDLMRNYTVAKSRENVTFSSPTEVKLVACTYHCG
jgi:hypothetical protein